MTPTLELYGSIDMWTLTGLVFSYLQGLGSMRNSRHSLSFWPAGTVKKLPIKSCTLIPYKATMSYCNLQKLDPIFRFSSEDIPIFSSKGFSAKKTQVLWEEGSRHTQRGTKQKNLQLLWSLSTAFVSTSARWDELQCIVQVVDTYNANAGARELHPAHNHCTRSTDDEEVRSQKPWRLLFPHNQYMRIRSELDSNANPLSSIRSRSKSHLSPTTTTCAFLSRRVPGWKSFWGFVLSQLR
jgi:hypothetical protein